MVNSTRDLTPVHSRGRLALNPQHRTLRSCLHPAQLHDGVRDVCSSHFSEFSWLVRRLRPQVLQGNRASTRTSNPPMPLRVPEGWTRFDDGCDECAPDLRKLLELLSFPANRFQPLTELMACFWTPSNADKVFRQRSEVVVQDAVSPKAGALTAVALFPVSHQPSGPAVRSHR